MRPLLITFETTPTKGTPLNLTEIHVVEGLKYLYCTGCTILTKIPVVEGLEVLDLNQYKKTHYTPNVL
jgi:hypothetical protein